MGLYTETIIKKEQNNKNIEKFADESLLQDKQMVRFENEMDDVQSAVLYIMEKFGKTIPRQFGHRQIGTLLDSMLDPLGMMYDYYDSVEKVSNKKTEYILAFREDGKAVALTPSIIGYRWFCPFDSKSGFANSNYCRNLKPGCYVFNKPLEEKKSIIFTFMVNVFKYLTIYDYGRLISATLLVSLLGLIIPKINKWVYSSYIPSPNSFVMGLQIAFLMYVMISLIRSMLTWFKSVYLSKVKMRVSMKVQSAIMAKVLHLPQSFFREKSSGKLSRRISSCGRLSDLILGIFMDILLDFGFSGVYVLQMKNLAPKLYIPALIFLGCKILLSIIGAIFYSINESRSLEVDMESTNLLYAAIRGIQKIKGMGAQKHIYSKWAELYRKTLKYNYKQPFFLKYQNALISAVSTAATISLMAIASHNDISREDYMTFMSSYTLIITVVSSLTDMMQNLFLMKVLSNNVAPIFEAGTEQTDSLEYVKNITGRIRVDNVYFKYPESQKGCLDGVSIDIKRGEKLAIVGESGCGKSTLLKLLIGFETPDSGMIYYDERAINSLNLKSLRRNIGSVFQFSKVFPGTIASNVTFTASGEVSEEKIWEAVDTAVIGDYIRELPLKLDTEISESNSCGFSGGQRQRILIARSLINNPKVLILDEATSALDNITQDKVLDNINKLSATVIMVAHRLSTVVNFDRIIMMDNGKIVEEGTYQELMDKNGRFAELVKKQLIHTKS